MKNKYRNELNALKTGLLYENYFQSFVVLVSAVLSVTYLLYLEIGKDFFHSHIFRLWLPLSCSIYLFKLVSAILFQSRRWDDHFNEVKWRYLFFITAFATGITLGFTASFIRFISNPEFFIIIMLIIGVISSGSVGNLSTNAYAFLCFNVTFLIPYVIQFVLSGRMSFAAITGAYLIVIIFTSVHISHTIEKALLMKIENFVISKKIQQSEDKFSKSFYSGVAPMVLLSFTDAKFIDVNSAFLSLLNYSREEVINKNPYELALYKNPAEIIKLILDTTKQGSIHNREISLITKDGTQKHCIMTIETFTVDSSLVALCMLLDFTERLDYENKLKVERDRYETAARAKSKFLATMSHEIRTPMNSIIGMTNLALMSEDNKEKDEYLGVVKESAEFLLVLINDILDITAIEAAKISIDPVDTDIHRLVYNSYKTMEMFARNRKLDLTYRIDDDVPRYIKASPERLRQVLINLISNAIKFTPDGSIKVHVRLLTDRNCYTTSELYDKYIEFTVTDTGIGIPEEKIEKIFESFTQADESTFRKYGGTGLGLTISKQLIKLMNGDIKVNSILGKGSSFNFILPLVPGDRPDESISFVLHSDYKNSFKKILIAEDNLLNQKLIEAFMKKTGHDYTLAENGADAISSLEADTYDLVLMDLEMPVMNGKEAIAKIRSGEAGDRNRNIPVYAMSAHVMQETIDGCLSSGFNGYVIKPLDLKKLNEIIG